jgi:hypothetical protein
MRLTVLSGEESEKVVEVTGERFVVGRDVEFHIKPPEGAASQTVVVRPGRMRSGPYTGFRANVRRRPVRRSRGRARTRSGY